MNEKIKKLWLEALRIGKYKQTKMRLKGVDGFCCLGVLCDLHRKETKRKWVQKKISNYNGNVEDHYMNESNVLPASVFTWAGLDSNDPMIKCKYLSYYNDAQNRSFNQIADLIERNL